jgi:HlyD family secretion protein
LFSKYRKSIVRDFLSSFRNPIIYTFIIFLHACNSDAPILTFTASQSDIKISVEGKGEIRAKSSNLISTPRIRNSLKIVSLTLEGTAVKKNDIVIKLESQDLENQYLTACKGLEIARAEALRRDSELSLEKLIMESQYKSLEATVAASKLRIKRLEFEPERKQEIERLEIEKNEFEIGKLRNKLSALESIQKEERARYQLTIKQEIIKRDQASGNLEKLILRAPIDGLVRYVKNRWSEQIKEGDDIRPGAPIVEIPDLSIMQVLLKLGETEAQKCVQGQTALVNVPALGNMSIPGKVSNVGKYAKSESRNSNVKKVDVMVDLDTTVTGLVPGLTANGEIFVDSLQQVFSLPIECIFEVDSTRIVYMQRGKFYEPCAIEVQRQNEDYVFVQGDIQIGAELALREPNSDQIKWPDQPFSPRREKVEPDSPIAQEPISKPDLLKLK